MSVVINLDGELDQWRSQVEADMSAGKLEDLDFSGNDAGMDAWPDDDAGVDVWSDDGAGAAVWPDGDAGADAWPDDDAGTDAWPGDIDTV